MAQQHLGLNKDYKNHKCTTQMKATWPVIDATPIGSSSATHSGKQLTLKWVQMTIFVDIQQNEAIESVLNTSIYFWLKSRMEKFMYFAKMRKLKHFK